MGTKLQKTVDYNTYQVITDYRDGYQYETKPQAYGGRGYAELLFFPTAEGYVKAVYSDDISVQTPVEYQYIYIYKDHLGNNRLSYTLDPQTEQVKILEENHYYPFGLKHGSYNAIRKDVRYKEQAASKKEVKQVVPEAVKFKYLYNGKELQDELGLNWYDYGARNYQADLGRWFNIDPLAEKYFSISSYNYVSNQPIIMLDPDGMRQIGFNNEDDDNSKRVHFKNDNYISDDYMYDKTTGELIFLRDTNMPDRIYDENGNLLFTFEYDGQVAESYCAFLNQSGKIYFSGFNFNNFNLARQLYRILVDNSNVEWALENYNGSYYIYSSHNHIMIDGFPLVSNYFGITDFRYYRWLIDIHSHQGGSYLPSLRYKKGKAYGDLINLKKYRKLGAHLLRSYIYRSNYPYLGTKMNLLVLYGMGGNQVKRLKQKIRQHRKLFKAWFGN